MINIFLMIRIKQILKYKSVFWNLIIYLEMVFE